MCLIFFALNNHPKYKLIVAGNRDEFYDRKTRVAGFWPEYPDLLGGKDLYAGGSWLVIAKSGRLSFITNYRDPNKIDPKAKSRGHLVLNYAKGIDSPGVYLNSIKKDSYNGFNLVVGAPDELHYLSNYGKEPVKMSDGIFGLSNHLLDTPWPKVKNGKSQFTALLKSENVSSNDFFRFLYNDGLAPEGELPDTGVGKEWERKLSAMFIKTPDYGSRCSTVILVDRNNMVTFSERVFEPETFRHATQRFQFSVKGK